METPEEEIQTALLSGNFLKATQVSQAWLSSILLEHQSTQEYLTAKEAFEISRFFQHRQERLAQTPVSRDRARLFAGLLPDLEKLKFVAFAGSPDTPVYKAACMFCHAQIAESYAKEFAGQKSYQLQHDEIMQLVYSLLMLGNYKSAIDALVFVHSSQPKNATVNYFLAWAYLNSGNEKEFYEYFEEALFIKPEIISEYSEFIPGGFFRQLRSVTEETEGSRLCKDRTYALLLEVNGIYKNRPRIRPEEVKRIETEYQRLKREFDSNALLQSELKPRLLHYLCRLTWHSQYLQNFEKFEEYRSEFVDLDKETWNSFQEKNFSK